MSNYILTQGVKKIPVTFAGNNENYYFFKEKKTSLETTYSFPRSYPIEKVIKEVTYNPEGVEINLESLNLALKKKEVKVESVFVDSNLKCQGEGKASRLIFKVNGKKGIVFICFNCLKTLGFNETAINQVQRFIYKNS